MSHEGGTASSAAATFLERTSAGSEQDRKERGKRKRRYGSDRAGPEKARLRELQDDEEPDEKHDRQWQAQQEGDKAPPHIAGAPDAAVQHGMLLCVQRLVYQDPAGAPRCARRGFTLLHDAKGIPKRFVD